MCFWNLYCLEIVEIKYRPKIKICIPLWHSLNCLINMSSFMDIMAFVKLYHAIRTAAKTYYERNHRTVIDLLRELRMNERSCFDHAFHTMEARSFVFTRPYKIRRLLRPFLSPLISFCRKEGGCTQAKITIHKNISSFNTSTMVFAYIQRLIIFLSVNLHGIRLNFRCYRPGVHCTVVFNNTLIKRLKTWNQMNEENVMVITG